MPRQTWFEKTRLEWIHEKLGIYGFIRREHLIKKFGISVPQASIDFRKYVLKYPRKVFYNPHSKRYERVGR